MKNNPNGLDKILKGKIVVPETDGHIFITTDINNPLEFIYIPTTKRILLPPDYDAPIIRVPVEYDSPREQWCAVFDNKIFTENDFVWVERANCWAYYPKT